MSISILGLYVLGGAVAGGLITWLLLHSRIELAKRQYANQLIAEKFIPKEAFKTLEEQTDLLRAELNENLGELKRLELDLAEKKWSLQHSEEKRLAQKEEEAILRKQAVQEFELVANKLLQEKARHFSDLNQEQLSAILTPFKDKLSELKSDMDKQFIHESNDRVSLRQEMKMLRTLNEQLSSDANNLASALKGDNKMQGNWGELQLERLLEQSGLQKGIHYSPQVTDQDYQGNTLRPDFVVQLPGNRHLVIDSKVSMKAFDRFFNAEDPDIKIQYLKEHIKSIRQHIKDLGAKKYQNLSKINSPDYVILFVPIESALSVAIQEDHQILDEAHAKHIVLVTNSTLLATVRTIGFLWKQDRQSKSVKEIALVSGQLYDKFVSFVEEMLLIGKRLQNTSQAYDSAMRKLSTGKRAGDTLIGKAESIRELGAQNTKQMPPELVENHLVDIENTK